MSDIKEKSGIDLIADEIDSISKAMERIKSSRLNEKAIVCLIYDALPAATYGHSKVGKVAIREVLEAASNLKNFYIKKAKALDKK